MSLPRFSTSRLALRPRTLADTDACIEMDGDPEVTRFIPGPWNDAAAHRGFVVERTRGPYPPGLGYWSVLHVERDNAFLGWVLLIPADTIGGAIEIGWRLVRAAWGKGYATEAARPVLTHAFTRPNVERVTADIAPNNIASIRVAEKLGLRPQTTTLRAGAPHVHFSMTRSAFERETRSRLANRRVRNSLVDE